MTFTGARRDVGVALPSCVVQGVVSPKEILLFASRVGVKFCVVRGEPQEPCELPVLVGVRNIVSGRTIPKDYCIEAVQRFSSHSEGRWTLFSVSLYMRVYSKSKT